MFRAIAWLFGIPAHGLNLLPFRSRVLFLSVSRPSLTNDIIEITGGRGVNAVLDSVGGPLITRLLGTLVPGGRIIAYGVQDPEPIPVTNAMIVYSNLRWEGFGIDRWLSGQDGREIVAMLNEIWSMVRLGTIQLRVDATYRLQDFQMALIGNSAKERVGKVILVSP
jgi:NADPH:quinone reductase-like Zn-dependent oxidoreductase